MIKILCKTSSGENLEVVYQWDANRIIQATGFSIDENLSYQIHFSSRRTQRAFVLIPEVVTVEYTNIETGETESYTALQTYIPIELLEAPDTIQMYIYTINADTDEMQTVGEVQIPLSPRIRPSDYISTHTNDMITVADGLELVGSMLYLSASGHTFGEGVDLSDMQSGGAVAGLTIPQLHGAAADASGITTIIEEGTA